MKNIIKTNKRGIIAILTLCMLLNTIGICAYATAVPEDNMATSEDTTLVVEETVVATEEPIIVTEENVVVTEENTQELMPMMARGCGSANNALVQLFGPGYTVTSTDGPWQYILGTNGFTGAYNTSTGCGYLKMSDGTKTYFQI